MPKSREGRSYAEISPYACISPPERDGACFMDSTYVAMLIDMISVGPAEWQLRGHSLRAVEVAGHLIEVLVRPRRPEIMRRVVEGPPVGSLHRAQLGALSLLPESVPIPWREIDFDTRLVVDTLPDGVVQDNRCTVTRIWRPPLEIVAVRSPLRSWSRRLQAVSLFAAVAPRVLQVEPSVQNVEEVRRHAERLGIGAYMERDPAEPLTTPPSSQRVRDDARKWEVAEAVYTVIAARDLTAMTRFATAAT